MYFTRLLTISIFTLALTFVACRAVGTDEEKMVFVTAGDHFRLGVVVSDLEDEKKSELGVSEGAYILEVLEDSEAERIGLMKKDLITKFDGKKVSTADDLQNYISEIEEEKEVELVVIREGKATNFKAKLQKIKEGKKVEVVVDDEVIDVNVDDVPLPPNFDFFISGEDEKGAFLGVMAENISEQMLSYFEVEYGVVIEEVVKDSPAEKAGLKAGDVIMKINDREIKDHGDLIRTINYFNPEEKVTVHYSRKGKKMNVSVTLEEKKGRKFGEKRWIFENNKFPGVIKSKDKARNVYKIMREIKEGTGKRWDVEAPKLRLRII